MQYCHHKILGTNLKFWKTILLWTTHFYIPKIKLDYSANAKVKPPKINPLKGNGYEILVFSNANAEKKGGGKKK